METEGPLLPRADHQPYALPPTISMWEARQGSSEVAWDKGIFPSLRFYCVSGTLHASYFTEFPSWGIVLKSPFYPWGN